MRVQRPATARFLVAIVVYGVVGLVALPDLRAARKGEVELAIHLAPRYPFWEPGTIRLSVHNRGKTAILIDSIRFVCGTLHLERQKSVPVRIDRDGSGLLVHSGIVRPKVAPTPRRRPLLSPPHLGTLSARRALFLRGGGTFFESWRPVLTHLASPQLTVLLRYRRIVGKKPLLYVPSGVPKRIEGGAFVVRYEPRERPTSGLVVVDEPTPVWNAALMHSETSATLTLELPSFSFEAAQRKLRDLSTKYRVGYWLAEKMWAFSNGKRTELHSATRSVTLPGDALRLIEQLNRRPARSTEVELAPSELAPKSLQRFLGALRRVRLVPTKRRVKSGLIWRISVDDRSLLALTERVRLAGLVFRGRTLRAK